jgi:hypothetical protein
VIWIDTGGWVLHPEPRPGSSFTFWQNPNGGYGIRSIDQETFLGYNNGTGFVMLWDGSNSALVLDWAIDPAPDPMFISGNLSTPAVPSAPFNLAVYSINYVSGAWTKGASDGFPAGRYKFRCVAPGEPCSAAARLESNAKTAADAQTANAPGFTVGNTYDCYSEF